ncbi:MAG TPA: hypothetical protein PLT93_04010, partial [Phycisphaerae bacterium]|nr:hypothetical protein [Phycisphaerae bacterium]
ISLHVRCLRLDEMEVRETPAPLEWRIRERGWGHAIDRLVCSLGGLGGVGDDSGGDGSRG